MPTLDKKYDFEKIGRQVTLNNLIESISGKANYLRTSGLKAEEKLKTLIELQNMSKEAYEILDSLMQHVRL